MKKLSFFHTLVLVSFLFQVFTSRSISQWQTYQTPVQSRFSDVCVVNQNIIWASGGTVVRTTNAGQTWIVAGTGLPSVQFYHITATDENNAWITGGTNSERLFRTTNSGLNWTEQFYSQPKWINGIHFFNASTGIFLRDPYTPPSNDTVGFFITRNGGLNWYRSPNTPRASLMLIDHCMSVFDTSLVCFLDENKLYRLIGGLDNPWQSVTVDSMSPYSTSACFINSNTGYLADGAGSTFRLLQSTNSGQNWSIISRDSSMSVYRLQCFGNSPLFFVSGPSDIKVSTNSGINWQYRVEYSNSDSISLGGMDGFDTTSVWIAGNKGRLFKYNPAYIGISQLSTLVPESFKLYQNYPNPFNPSTKIKFDLPNAGKLSFRVYDILGKKIHELSEYKTSGVYEIDFDASGYSSGVYYYSIEFDEFTQTRKMVVIK
ncbi:MAG: T9SS type A sorting domain-containing protein [Ignavibacteria bacterium]|nr:T9SS type A sorting domain-containing protein [Ignavibacteria bacterium]